MAQTPVTPKRGVLYPGRLPTDFNREMAQEPLSELVRWWWTSKWELPRGTVSRQYLLPYPASNFVIEQTPLMRGDVRVYGPSSRASVRELSGAGWAVSVLLQPAALPLFTAEPSSLRDSLVSISADSLRDSVLTSMQNDDAKSAREALKTWFAKKQEFVTTEGLLANKLADLINDDATITSVAVVAQRLNISERTVHRLTQTYVGITPYAMITRRRLQDAAEAIRTEPTVSLTDIAHSFGFTDQAHFTKVFKEQLGLTPSAYRKSSLE